jgi:hypothetical protein
VFFASVNSRPNAKPFEQVSYFFGQAWRRTREANLCAVWLNPPLSIKQCLEESRHPLLICSHDTSGDLLVCSTLTKHVSLFGKEFIK